MRLMGRRECISCLQARKPGGTAAVSDYGIETYAVVGKGHALDDTTSLFLSRNFSARLFQPCRLSSRPGSVTGSQRILSGRRSLFEYGGLATMDGGNGGSEALAPSLVAESQRGDTGAFERLYRLYVGRIYAICLRLLADPVQAEILTQDVFVRAWQKLDTFVGRGEFAGWLRRLAVNVVVEDRRAQGRWNRWFEPYQDPSEGPVEAENGSGRVRPATRTGAVAPPATEAAIDLVWLWNGPLVHHHLTVAAGWSADAYEKWLADTFVRDLLDEAPTDRG